MRLTHHHPSTRSFLIIIIVVLATVYTAFTLINLQQRNSKLGQTKSNPKITQTALNTNDWKNYVDPAYPLNILVPEDWQVQPDESYSGFYTVNFETKNRGVLKIFISQTEYAGVKGNEGTTYKNNAGIEVTKYDDWLYTAKVGDYYYTFDATLGINLEKELSEIIRLAKFD